MFVTVLCVRRARRRRAAREYHSVVLGVGLDEMGGGVPDPQTEQQDNTALMNALFFLRGHPEYELKHPLRRTGTRRGKYFFLLNERRAAGRVVEDAAVLELVEQGADGAFAVSEEGVALTHLFGAMGRAHPNVAAPRVAEVIPATNVLAVVRAWERRGSLRDALHGGCDPQQPARAKYAARGTPLPVRTVARYGRDILEALLYFQQLGYPCYHLHAGNVLVDPAQRRATVTDHENNVLGVAPRHAAVIRALHDRARVAPDVACFACVLAEMASGVELTSLQAADVLLSPTSTVPAPVRAVLTSILAPFATAPPDVRDLLRLDFFADAAPPDPVPRLTVEFPVAVQQLLVSASDALAVSVCSPSSSSSLASTSPVPVKSPRPYNTATGTSPHSSSSSSHTKKRTLASTAGTATASTGHDSTRQEQQERLGETTSLLDSGGGDGGDDRQ